MQFINKRAKARRQALILYQRLMQDMRLASRIDPSADMSCHCTRLIERSLCEFTGSAGQALGRQCLRLVDSNEAIEKLSVLHENKVRYSDNRDELTPFDFYNFKAIAELERAGIVEPSEQQIQLTIKQLKAQGAGLPVASRSAIDNVKLSNTNIHKIVTKRSRHGNV